MISDEFTKGIDGAVEVAMQKLGALSAKAHFNIEHPLYAKILSANPAMRPICDLLIDLRVKLSDIKEERRFKRHAYLISKEMDVSVDFKVEFAESLMVVRFCGNLSFFPSLDGNRKDSNAVIPINSSLESGINLILNAVNGAYSHESLRDFNHGLSEVCNKYLEPYKITPSLDQELNNLRGRLQTLSKRLGG